MLVSLIPLYHLLPSLFKRDQTSVATASIIKFFFLVVIFIIVIAFYFLEELLIFYL